MKRDIMIGMTVSLLIHGGFALVRSGPIAAIRIVDRPADVVKIFHLPPEEPVVSTPPEPGDPVTKPDVRPPMLPEIISLRRLNEPIQPFQPPAPEGVRVTQVINIPANLNSERGSGRGAPFDLSGLDQAPSARYQASPVYPFEMRHAGVTGQVVVGFIVDAAGNTQNVYVISSSHREFEAAAIQAVSKWKFKAGRKAAVAVATRMQVPIVFNITSEI